MVNNTTSGVTISYDVPLTTSSQTNELIQTLNSTFQAFPSELQQALAPSFNLLASKLGNIESQLNNIPAQIDAELKNIQNNLPNELANGLKQITPDIAQIFKPVSDNINATMETIKNGFYNINKQASLMAGDFDAIKNQFQTFSTSVSSSLGGIFNWIQNFFDQLGTFVENKVGKPLKSFFYNNIVTPLHNDVWKPYIIPFIKDIEALPSYIETFGNDVYNALNGIYKDLQAGYKSISAGVSNIEKFGEYMGKTNFLIPNWGWLLIGIGTAVIGGYFLYDYATGYTRELGKEEALKLSKKIRLG